VKSVALKNAGVHCEGCAATIKALVEREPGVRMAAVNFASGEARILFDPAQIGEDRLITVVERPGYRVTGRGA
jgi:copper chaperone CopZ